MSISVTFKTAMHAWQTRCATPRFRTHLADAALAALHGPSRTRRRAHSAHIARCPFCAERYRAMWTSSSMADIQNWAIISRKAAAAAAKQYPMVYYSAQGEYKIEILQNSDGGDSGLLILHITDLRLAAQCEGREYMICDAGGRTLLRSQVINGRALQKIDELSRIDDRNFLVRPSIETDTA